MNEMKICGEDKIPATFSNRQSMNNHSLERTAGSHIACCRSRFRISLEMRMKPLSRSHYDMQNKKCNERNQQAVMHPESHILGQQAERQRFHNVILRDPQSSY
jgi:hypothetical protein